MTEAELLQLDDLQFVERAYPLLLGRPADPTGLRDYLKRIREGVSKKQIVAELRASEEGQRYAECSSAAPAKSRPALQRGGQSLATLMQLADEAFVDQAYRLALGRPADLAGRRDYVLALQRGVERLEVLHQLLHSREGMEVQAALPELRQAIERHRLRRLPGIRHALRAWRRLSAPLRGATAPTSTPIAAPRSIETASLPTEGIDPYRPRRNPSPPPRRFSIQSLAAAPLINHAEAMARLAQASTMADQLIDKPVDKRVASPASAPWELEFDRFVGPVLYGVSRVAGNAAPFAVEFGDCSLGRVTPGRNRPNEDAAPGTGEHDFAVILGGVLQFSAMAPRCSSVKLAQIDAAGGARRVELQNDLAEALTFAPMRALLRPLFGRKTGQVRSMRMISSMEVSIVFEADETTDPEAVVFMDLYQEQTPGRLARIGRFEIELVGQVVDIEFHLMNPDAPFLMVITDRDRGIVVTDCFPLPSLCSEKNAPLIEYHVVLESGKSPIGVVAKIARSFLDRTIRLRAASTLGSASTRIATAVSSERTCLVIIARDGADPNVENLLKAHRALAEEVVFLDSLGRVSRSEGEVLDFPRFVNISKARHFLFIDNHVQLRPDFWSVMDDNAYRGTAEASITHWHSIWIDGLSRPQVVKVGLMLHPAFAQHRLLETRALLAERAAVTAAVDLDGSIFASGRLVLEKAFCLVDLADTATIPVVMHTVRTPIAPLVAQRYQAEQAVLDSHPPRLESRGSGPGVSIVINYRDGVEDTLRCLASIAAQRCNGPVELVLVNNGSTTASVLRITSYARDLFGNDNLRTIDYPHRFNHSTQCNIATVAARHDMLLMLSNDSVLRTPTAIARSAQVAAIPWVGTCGFRIIGDEGNKSRLQSLGLALNPRRYLFSGGSPVSTSLAPAFALDCTFEVLGNTFAAVMLRRDVYRALDGLDSIAFPTNYNDIDFSFRATNAGYRHVAIGSEIVEHMGRGSREADQDLPIDQRIIERAPRLDFLARIGFQQL